MSSISLALKSARALEELVPGSVSLKFNGPQFDRVKKLLTGIGVQVSADTTASTVEEMPSLETLLVAVLETTAPTDEKPAPEHVNEWIEKILSRTKAKANGDDETVSGAKPARRGTKKRPAHR